MSRTKKTNKKKKKNSNRRVCSAFESALFPFSFSPRTHVLVCHSHAYVTGRLVVMDSAARAPLCRRNTTRSPPSHATSASAARRNNYALYTLLAVSTAYMPLTRGHRGLRVSTAIVLYTSNNSNINPSLARHRPHTISLVYSHAK